LTPFAKFPINGYDVDDPGVIFENWTLTVSGAVKKPGDYKLAQVQALPRYRQNTRHICVEGWDVIGRFGGARLSDFLQHGRRRYTARFITVNCADDYYESLDMATALHPQTCFATKCTSSRSRASTARRCACRFPPRLATSRRSI
jgi:DMSO/TMAO reductase YedYZ molybdopterin-dependent catalytic subunit